MKKIAATVLFAVFCFLATKYMFGAYERNAYGQTLGQPFTTGSVGSALIECAADNHFCANLESDLDVRTLKLEFQNLFDEVEQDETRRLIYKSLDQTLIERIGSIKWCLGFDSTPDTTHITILQNEEIAFSFSPMIGSDIFGRKKYVGVIESGYYYPCGTWDEMAFRHAMKTIGLPPE